MLVDLLRSIETGNGKKTYRHIYSWIQVVNISLNLSYIQRLLGSQANYQAGLKRVARIVERCGCLTNQRLMTNGASQKVAVDGAFASVGAMALLAVIS